jgi:hypothetical protein
MPRRLPFALALVLAVWPLVGLVDAQVLMQRTEPPAESAALAPWFLADEPLVFNGMVYQRAGAEVFFNGDAMVRVGWFKETPVYADTTVEPNSVVLVPVGGRLLQPYERIREGDIAGTTGSGAPWFPVALERSGWGAGQVAMAAGPPVQWETAPLAPLAGRASGREPVPAVERTAVTEVPRPVGTTGIAAAAAPAPRLYLPGGAAQSVRTAQASLGVWIEYAGATWQACGPARPTAGDAFEKTGTYRGFPVFAPRGAAGGDVIYLPSREGFAAPYRRGPVPFVRPGACLP